MPPLNIGRPDAVVAMGVTETECMLPSSSLCCCATKPVPEYEMVYGPHLPVESGAVFVVFTTVVVPAVPVSVTFPKHRSKRRAPEDT